MEGNGREKGAPIKANKDIHHLTFFIYSNSNFIRHPDAYDLNADVQYNRDNGKENEFHLNKFPNHFGYDDDDKNNIQLYNFSSSDYNCIT